MDGNALIPIYENIILGEACDGSIKISHILPLTACQDPRNLCLNTFTGPDMGTDFPLLAFLVVPYHFHIHYALRKLVSGSARTLL